MLRFLQNRYVMYTRYQSGAIVQVKNTANGNQKSYLAPPTSYMTITTFPPLEGGTECQQ